MENLTSRSWENFQIHPLITRCLFDNNFTHPTEIQSHCLSQSAYKLDLIIASKTVKSTLTNSHTIIGLR